MTDPTSNPPIHDEAMIRAAPVAGGVLGPLMGVDPTGRVVTVMGIWIDRLAGGRLAESWLSFDALGLLHQVGSAPSIA